MDISTPVIVPIITEEFVEVEELDTTDRGEGGFGSTDEYSAPTGPTGYPEDKNLYKLLLKDLYLYLYQ